MKIEEIIPPKLTNVEITSYSSTEYVLHDNIKQSYTKISKEVFNLLSLIDGRKDFFELTNEYEEKFALKISPLFAYELLYNKICMYDLPNSLSKNGKKVKPKKTPNYLRLSFIIFPEKKLNKLIPRLHFLYKKNISVIVLIGSIIVLSISFIFHINIYQHINLKSSFVYFILLMATSVTFHEIGHVTAANYFGAKHGGIGGGFYLFTPVYFADVTDIWRLSKQQRIIVNVSGVYFELIFTSIITIIGWIVNCDILILLALIVFIKSLFNFNPLIRSDGYWILSDLIERPNLFKHSFDKVVQLFKIKSWTRNKKWNYIDYLLLIYGLISFSFMVLFLYYILILNPRSVIFFPRNLFYLIKDIFHPHYKTSLKSLTSLIAPLMFYILLFNMGKKAFKKKKKEI